MSSPTLSSCPPHYRAAVLRMRPDARLELIRRGKHQSCRVIDREERLGSEYHLAEAGAWRAAYRRLTQADYRAQQAAMRVMEFNRQRARLQGQRAGN